MSLALSSAVRRPAEHSSLAPAKQRILETANRLFYNEGIRPVGIDRLISESAVTKATFYKHFGSKDGLVLAYLKFRHDELDRELWRHVDAHEDVIDLLRSLLATTVDTVMAPDFRGCAFLNAAAEYSDPTNPVRRTVIDHREWYSEVLFELLRQAGHPMPGDAADDLMLARDGAMCGAYAGDAIAATSALGRGFERAIAETTAS